MGTGLAGIDQQLGELVGERRAAVECGSEQVGQRLLVVLLTVVGALAHPTSMRPAA